MFTSQLFYKELKNNLILIKKPKQFLRTIICFLRAIIISKFLNNYLKENKLDPSKTILYSFWFDVSALGISLLKKNYIPKIRACVSKAHGGDLYFESNPNNYIPFRGFDIENLNAIFPDSDAQKVYLKKKFPNFKNKIYTSRLGTVNDYKLTKFQKNTKLFSVVSCSYLVEIKRVHLIIECLKILSKNNPSKKIIWNHFGGGPLSNNINEMAKLSLKDQVDWFLHGNVKNEYILSWYKKNNVDAFINVSKSEGAAVSIMEAMSFGIPIILSNVGGNPEMVVNQSGILLSKDPTPIEISKALQNLISSSKLSKKLKTNSLKTWKDKYCANKNFNIFLKQVIKLKN